MRKQCLCLNIIVIFCLSLPACSINKIASKAVANALTKDGSSDVFTSDPDPQLVGDALPFAIKMYEALLDAVPDHQGLHVTTGSLFIMYANAFIQKPAEQMSRELYAERQIALERAKKMYLRGVELLYSGLELKYPGFKDALKGQLLLPGVTPEILRKLKKEDLPSLYWAAAGGISAFSLNPMDLELAFRVPEYLALINRAYELDPDYNSGALDDFLMLYYASVPDYMGGDKAKAEIHFKKAIEKSKGLSASPYVSYAQAISIPNQDYDTFKLYLEAALAIDIDGDPSNRLVNVIFQRKARYLLDNAEEFFFFLGTNEEGDED